MQSKEYNAFSNMDPVVNHLISKDFHFEQVIDLYNKSGMNINAADEDNMYNV